MFKPREFVIGPTAYLAAAFCDKLNAPDLNYMSQPGSAVAAMGGSMLARGDVRGLGYIAGGAALSALETVWNVLFKGYQLDNKRDVYGLLFVGASALVGGLASAVMNYCSHASSLKRAEQRLESERRELEMKLHGLENVRGTHDRYDQEFQRLGLPAQPIDQKRIDELREKAHEDLLKRLSDRFE